MFLTVRYKQGNPQAAVVEDRSGKLETRILRELDNTTQVRCKVGISLHTQAGALCSGIYRNTAGSNPVVSPRKHIRRLSLTPYFAVQSTIKNTRYQNLIEMKGITQACIYLPSREI